MSREENVKIFENTKQMCRTNRTLAEAVRKSTDSQEIILETDTYPMESMKRFDEKARIIVSKKRSFEAASAYKGLKTCVHNFASAKSPGGGVVRGASAQEECLCRTSSLYFSLNTERAWNEFYMPHRETLNNIHNDDMIFTPDVIVFKTDTAAPRLMPESEWYKVDVITLAAPKLRNQGRNSDHNVTVTDRELLAIHEKRMRRFLELAKNKGEDVLILGAFGCGAFMNSPQVVAQAMKNILPEYMYDFKVIEFAVYCSPMDDTNYKVFDRVLKSLN